MSGAEDRMTVRMFGLEERVERLAESGGYPNKSEVIRDAVHRLPDPADADTDDASADAVERGGA